MGREAKIKKTRKCRECGSNFRNKCAAEIAAHEVKCAFESRTGIQVISFGDDLDQELQVPVPIVVP